MFNKLSCVMAISLASLAATYSTSALAVSASAEANAEFISVDVRTTSGTATATFTGTDFFEASGMVTGGIDSLANNGETFDQEVNAGNDEGTAINDGMGLTISSGSFAAVAADFPEMTAGTAFTFIDSEIEFAGVGSVEIDLGYSLFVDVVDNGPNGYAAASIFATLSDAFDEIIVGVDGIANGGDFASGVITLLVNVDDMGIAPYTDILTVGTTAAALAAPVPVPAAVWLFGSAVVGLFGARRRAAALA